MSAGLKDRLKRLTHAHPARPSVTPAGNGFIPRVSRQSFHIGEHPGLESLPGAAVDAARVLLRDDTASPPPVEEWVFLDTETTGMAGGAGTYVFLTGLGQMRGERFEVDYFFLDDLGAEPELLGELARRLSSAPVVVTYNGKLFDLPLLETRFRMNHLAFPLAGAVHLDLLYPARLLWRLRCGSARLIALEEAVLDFHRADDVPGEEIPGRYFAYLRSGRTEPLLPVIRHNGWDIASLAALTGRMLGAVGDTEADGHDALDRFGLSRLFEKAGKSGEARRLYESALAQGLPRELERVARRNLALLYKRERAHQRAAAQWKRLADSHVDSLSAYEELAICYEHRLREPTAALSTTREALALVRRLHSHPGVPTSRLRAWKDRFGKRLERLEAKLQRTGQFPAALS